MPDKPPGTPTNLGRCDRPEPRPIRPTARFQRNPSRGTARNHRVFGRFPAHLSAKLSLSSVRMTQAPIPAMTVGELSATIIL